MDSQFLDPRSIEDVASCRLCANLGMDHVPAQGAVGASLMIIGSHPGHREVETAKPIQGAAGELIDMLLSRAGLSRLDAYITYVVKCKPPNMRNLLPAETRNCMQQWLKQEIKAINPSVVLLIGKQAFNDVLGSAAAGVEFTHGGSTTNKSGRLFMFSYHPSWFIRRGNLGEFMELGDKIANHLEGGSPD